jgi:transposase
LTHLRESGRGLLTNNQAVKVDALKSEWREFATMRGLAMRFRGILRSKNVAKLGVWLTDAQQSGLYAMQRFARTLRRDIDAVRSAVTESWSNVSLRRGPPFQFCEKCDAAQLSRLYERG